MLKRDLRQKSYETQYIKYGPNLQFLLSRPQYHKITNTFKMDFRKRSYEIRSIKYHPSKSRLLNIIQ